MVPLSRSPSLVIGPLLSNSAKIGYAMNYGSEYWKLRLEILPLS